MKESRRNVIWLLPLFFLLVVVITGLGVYSMSMPGRNSDEALEMVPSELKASLRAHVKVLSEEIGERNLSRTTAYRDAEQYIVDQFQGAGASVTKQAVSIRGKTLHNIEAVVNGSNSSDVDQLVVGAHYDTVQGSPGANDNGTGVAAVLELANRFHETPSSTTLRFVAFVNEEPPYFGTQMMGSYQYAKWLRDRGISLKGMLSLETIGYYNDEPGTQNYPFPFSFFYPDRGNFLAFVGNLASRSLVRQFVGEFRQTGAIPAEGSAPPSFVPGVGWSDHWAFWQFDYPALMVTDTAPYRYPHYHRFTDRADKIKYDRFTLAVEGLERTLRSISEAVTS